MNIHTPRHVESSLAPRATRRGAFTLMELLVVLAIIALLLAMLTPCLMSLQQLVQRVMCNSNLHQTFTGLAGYTAENDGWFPPVDYGDVGHDTYNNHRFRSTRSGYDLRVMIEPYFTKGLPTWACPSTDGPPIGDANNTRHWCYMNFMYFPGTRWPFAAPSDLVPRRRSQYPTDMPLMQDLYFLTMGQWFAASVYMGNHAPGGWAYQPLPDNNPSFATYASDAPPDGANIVLGDGSARWYNAADLQDVGRAEVHPNDHHLISLPWP